MKNVMIPEELFGKIIKYHLLDQEQEADDIRKGLEKKLDAMVNREVYSKSKTAPTEEEREKFRQEYLDISTGSILLEIRRVSLLQQHIMMKHSGFR